MKKLIAVLLLLTMVVSLFAGCKKDDNTPDTNALKDAVAYLTNMYQTAGKGETITIEADLDVINVVVIAGESYNVEWSVEITSGTKDSVTVGESKEANHVKLDITEKNSEEVTFTATATVKDAKGNSEKVSFDYKVPAVKLAGDGMTMEELVEAAYALENGATMEGLATLKGVITAINTPWDSGYKNITVTIQIGELADKPIKCYRLSGDGADALGVGDIITVSGTLTNYNGTIEFAQGCIVEEIIKSEEPAPEAPKDPAEIVDAAYALEPGTSLPYEASLTGVITEIAIPWDEGYQNITVIIEISDRAGKPIKCYRLKGEGAADLAVGDTITSTGYLTNYNGEIEFAAGCVVSNIVKGNGETPENPDNIEKPDVPDGSAANLKNGTYMIVDKKAGSEVGAKCPGEDKTYGYLYDDYAASEKHARTIYKLTKVSDGKYTIQDCYDRYLGVSGTYRSFQLFSKNEGDHCLWSISKASDGQYIIKNNSNSRYIDYSEEFSSFGVYLDSELPEDGKVALIAATAASSGNNNSGSNNSGSNNSGSNNSGSNTNAPTGSAASLANGTYMIVDKKAGSEIGAKCPGEDKTYGYLYDDYAASEKHARTIYKLTKVSTGKYTIQDCYDRYLGVSGTYRSFQLFSKNEGDHCLWSISVASDGQYIIKNVSNSRYIDYSEGKNSFGVYLDSELPEDGKVALVAATPASSDDNTGGNSGDSSSTITPSTTVTVADGNYVIYVPEYDMALSSNYTGYYNSGVAVTESNGSVSGYGDTEVWKITNNGDGTISISINGKKLGMADQYSSMSLGAANDKWKVFDAGNGMVYIQNVGREAYIEWYADRNNWSGYGTINADSKGMFALILYAA